MSAGAVIILLFAGALAVGFWLGKNGSGRLIRGVLLAGVVTVLAMIGLLRAAGAELGQFIAVGLAFFVVAPLVSGLVGLGLGLIVRTPRSLSRNSDND